MIYPRATDLIANIEGTMISHIEPSLGTVAGRSAAATIKHLLRHVRLRIEEEGRYLTADIAALKPLLGQVKAYFGTAAVVTLIDEHLAKATPGEGYQSLDDLAAQSGALREALQQALKELVRIRPQHRDDPAYVEIRAAIRAYLVSNIEEEEQLIGPAFYGQGPRR